ncbi:Rv0361 family membrane protein [Actinokineospora bangkokensis]|uniref:DUF2510 domain-containing protein n=1 Tax=Actinokineospora bangkokensis TaxID=1193682 RepID=A0A1Q9LRD6_9PSEU|nr:DUF2510 domain-containing protein [Actinokineospora bangkokensis]OLR94582.1 hypothetical protein BJP25_12660 [Actinokineospora bangkokensis]
MTDCRSLLDAPVLGARDQGDLFVRLRAALADPDHRTEAWPLLVRLRHRTDLDERVAAALERVLGPGWRPDPRGHHEARYWDGQSWTTLVRTNGHEYTDRARPPEVPSAPPQSAAATPGRAASGVLGPRRAPSPVEQDAPRGRRWWLVAAGVFVIAAGVGGGILLDKGFGPSDKAASQLARDFVDAVNTHDTTNVTQYVCTKDRTDTSYLYGSIFDRAKVTLERVDPQGDDPRFTILAARTSGTSALRLNIPLTVEDGEWRVCDMNKALSGR